MPVSEEVPLTAFTLELKHALSAVGKKCLHVTCCLSFWRGMARYLSLVKGGFMLHWGGSGTAVLRISLFHGLLLLCSHP